MLGAKAIETLSGDDELAAEIYYHAAEAKKRLDKTERACEFYEKAIELNVSFDDVSDKLAELQP